MSSRSAVGSQRSGVKALAITLTITGFATIVSAQQPEQTVAQTPPQAAAQAASQTPGPRPQEPPFPNRFNELTPAWLTVRGEFRDRMEGGTNIGYTPGLDDVYWLNRFRFDVSVRPSAGFGVLVQAQDARVANKDVGATSSPFRNPFDLRQAYADIGNAEKGPFTVRVGRQEMFFGEQRLVGHLTWVNAARSFDGVRATYKTKGFKLDTFATSVVRIIDGEFDKSGNGNRFLGAYASATDWIPKATVEPYVFWRRDHLQRGERGDIGNLSAATIGTRWVGKLPAGFDYGLEMAIQTGAMASDEINAWAGHWIAGKTLGGPWKVRVAEEYNAASGDSNPTDGKRQTFDQLYPTGHDKLGLADQVGWKNIRDLRSIVELTPFKGWPISASVHSWWLADTHDALYNAGGATVARVPGGAVGSRVGDEVDVQLTHALTPQVLLAAGIARVFPSQFLDTVTPGAHYTYPFMMVTYVFLAAR
jgi:alginate export protein